MINLAKKRLILNILIICDIFYFQLAELGRYVGDHQCVRV